MKKKLFSLRQLHILAIFVTGVLVLTACGSIAQQPGSLLAVVIQNQVALNSLKVDSAPVSTDSPGCFQGDCHASLKIDQKQFVHDPFAKEECLACHTSNHADPVFTAERTLELCYSCHSAESLGNSHPIGAGVIDSRNGKTITCLSCHDYHSADYRYVLKMDGQGALCVSCHTKFVH